MPTSNNYQNPKGYALCIGINDFTHQKKLNHCVSDVEFWENFLKNKCSFNVVRTLKNEQATNAAIFKGMWCLASYAQPGDIVAITFSTHGSSSGTHTLFSHNDQITDNEFLFFIKAFKPGVRVVVVTDACQSSGYVGSGSRKKLSAYSKNRIFEALDNGTDALNFKLNELIRTSNELPITCHVGHFASASSEANVGDGLLVKYTKNMGFYSLDWYEIGQWRDTMEDMFRARLNPTIAFINEIKGYVKATYSQPGDIVSITISSHGTFAGDNFISLHDGKISEAVFRLFLRAFKPGVRVVIITDTCQSGTFVDYTPPSDISSNALNELKQFFKSKLPQHESKFRQLLEVCKESPLAAHIAHFASSMDDTDVVDGLLVSCTRQLNWPLNWYELGQYRKEMQDKFRALLYDPLSCVNEILVYCMINEALRRKIDALVSQNKASGRYSFLVESFSSLNKTIALVKELKTVKIVGEDELGNNVFEKTLDRIVNNAKYQFNKIPVLSFHGKKSPAFQKQYAFTKSSPAFILENS